MITSLNTLQFQSQARKPVQSNNFHRLNTIGCDVVSFKGKEEVNEEIKSDKRSIVDAIVVVVVFVFSIIQSILSFLAGNTLNNSINKFNKEWNKTDNKPLSKIASFNIVNLPGVIYNPANNLINLNYAKLKSNDDIKYNVNVLDSLIKTSKKLGSKIRQITEKSSQKLQIPAPFVPNVNLYYEESGRMGFYSPGVHEILLNAYHIDEAHDPQSIISEVISHELSHSKSNMDFSIIDPKDISENCKKNQSQLNHLQMLKGSPIYKAYRQYREENTPVSDKEYARIKYHLEKHLLTLTDNESMHKETMKAEKLADEVFGTIKKETGLGYKELGLLDTAQLVNHKRAVVDPNNFHAHAQFDDQTIEAILKVAESNKKLISSLLAKLSQKQQKLLKAHMKYQDIYDESIARMNSSSVTGENIKDGTISNTKPAIAISKTHLDDLFDLLLRTDDEVRGMIESGEVQLTKKYVETIANNQAYYQKLDVSKQKN